MEIIFLKVLNIYPQNGSSLPVFFKKISGFKDKKFIDEVICKEFDRSQGY